MSSPGGGSQAKGGDRAKASGIDTLAEVLGDRQCSASRRALAAVALGRAGDPRALQPLVAAVDEAPEVAVAAIDALGRLGEPGAVPPLIVALASGDLKVKEHAIAALGKIGDPRAIDPLIAKLQDRSEAFYVRKKAARTLYAIYKQGHLDGADKDKALTHLHSWHLL